MRKALTSAMKRKTKTLDTKKPQSSGHPSNPHLGSSFGTPFNHNMFFVSLNLNWGNSSLENDTNEPTCCIVIAVSFTYCMERTEQFPSAFPFSSIKTCLRRNIENVWGVDWFSFSTKWLKLNLLSWSLDFLTSALETEKPWWYKFAFFRTFKVLLATISLTTTFKHQHALQKTQLYNSET